MKWYLAVLKKYAVFSGRAQRMEYWLFNLFNLIILNALAFIEGFVRTIPETENSVLATLYFLVILLPNLAVTVRRLHDTGRSGWWVLISALPIIGAIVLLVFLLMDSQPGENEYGPFPKEAVTEPTHAGRGFWLGWVLATTVGLGLGLTVAEAMVFEAAAAIDEVSTIEPLSVLAVVLSLVLFAVGGAMAGSLLGTAQWLVLQGRFSQLGLWILATTVGFAVGDAMGAEMSGAVALALTGASVGIAQWLILRRWQVSRAGWWVLASIAGSVVSNAALEFAGGTSIETIALLVPLFVFFVGYGAITGAVMVWLLRQPVKEEPSPLQAVS